MDYNKSIHRLGRISTAIALLLILMVPIVITAIYREDFDFGKTIAAVTQVVIVYIPVCITEVLSFSPALGQGGTYLAFVSGNIANMKLPAAVSGQNLLGVEPGSDKAEVVSVLSIGASTIVTMLVLAIGMFFLSYLVPVLQNPILKPGFDNIMPALIGAMLINYIVKSPKLILAPLVMALILSFSIPAAKWGLNQGYSLVGTIIVSCIVGIIMFNKGWLDKKEKQAETSIKQ
ncbi:MAG: hypothetical protein AAGU74_04145 [Bacillota bacterium]